MLPLIIAICIIVGLVLLFIFSFWLYHRIPAPKGCEDIKVDDSLCSHCNKECSMRKKEFKEEE